MLENAMKISFLECVHESRPLTWGNEPTMSLSVAWCVAREPDEESDGLEEERDRRAFGGCDSGAGTGMSGEESVGSIKMGEDVENERGLVCKGSSQWVG